MKQLIRIALIGLFVLTMGLSASSVSAATILLVSDANVPSDVGGNHNDDTLVSWLQGLGYTVDTSGMGKAMQEAQDPFNDVLKKAAMDNADLILLSRRTQPWMRLWMPRKPGKKNLWTW